MPIEQPEIALIELIYQAVMEPERWPDALAVMVERLNSDHGFLFTNKSSRTTMPFAVTTGLREDDIRRYFSEEGIRLWAPWQSIVVPGRAIGQNHVVSDREFERLEVYNEIIKPTKGYHAGFVQQDLPDLCFHAAICRRRPAGPFEAGALRLIQRLLPHLTTALELQKRLGASERNSRNLGTLLDRLQEGAVITDERGRPQFINAWASELLDQGDGLFLTASGLRAATPAASRRLLDAITAVSAASAEEGQRLHLARPSCRLPLLLNVIPLWRLNVSVGGTGPAHVAIFIREPDAPLKIDRPALLETFKVTPREADVAILLARGLTLEVIAVERGLQVGTVRFNLKRVFEKLGVHNQAAVVAVVRSFSH